MVPGLDAAIHAALPPKRTGESQAITEIRNEVPAKPLDDPEHLDWPKSIAEAGTVTSLGDTPLIVISRAE